jgi:sulfide:quinone oxidoreductase
MADGSRIVIAGGSIAGLEALLALRTLAGPQPRITLITDRVHRVERSASVADLFDRGVAPVHDIDAIAADQGAELHLDRLAIVRRGAVELSGGLRVDFDALVIAIGARDLHALPGAVTFSGVGDIPAAQAVRDELLAREAGSVAFVVPTTATWPLPLYELALRSAAHLRSAGLHDVPVTIVTPEPAPLAIFGPRAAAALQPLLERLGVAMRVGVRPLEAVPGELRLDDGGALAVDRVVALPSAHGRPPAGLPSDANGFLPVDPHGRVDGTPGVYAAGDAADFPLKQGGLAAQQADAVAAAIAADLAGDPPPAPTPAVVRGRLELDDARLYLRAEVARGPDGTVRAVSEGVASTQPLWSPPDRLAARYLGPYLAQSAR